MEDQILKMRDLSFSLIQRKESRRGEGYSIPLLISVSHSFITSIVLNKSEDTIEGTEEIMKVKKKFIICLNHCFIIIIKACEPTAYLFCLHHIKQKPHPS